MKISLLKVILFSVIGFAVLAAEFASANPAASDSTATVYAPLWCPRNIFNLVQSLAKSGIDIEPMRVLYIFGAQTDSGEPLPIHPRASRIAGEEWAFHVVLEYQGLILDPDFTQHAQVVSTQDYFRRMWRIGSRRSPTKSHEAIWVRSIPAADYLSDYQGNWEWYLNEDPDPAVSAQIWLGADAAPNRTP